MRLGKRGAPPGREDFEVFVQSHGARLARAAYVLTGNERDSEDLVQETMLLAFRNWTAVHAAHNQGAYVRRILVNRYISDKRRPRVLSQALTEGDAGVPDPVTERIEELAMWSALQTLPSRQRAIIVLSYYEGLSAAEIAEILGCGASSVRSAASKALHTLRRDWAARTAQDPERNVMGK